MTTQAATAIMTSRNRAAHTIPIIIAVLPGGRDSGKHTQPAQNTGGFKIHRMAVMHPVNPTFISEHIQHLQPKDQVQRHAKIRQK